MNVLHERSILREQCVLVAVFASLILLCQSSSAISQSKPVPYRHAYYLFLEGGGTGCEECYVPLLITQNSLEQIAAGGQV